MKIIKTFDNRFFIRIMVNLFEKEQTEIFMMIGYEKQTRTYEKECVIFNNTHPESNATSKSSVTKPLKYFITTGSVKDRKKIGRPKTATKCL